MITGLASNPKVKFPQFIPAFVSNYHADLLSKNINCEVSSKWYASKNGWIITTKIFAGDVEITNHFLIQVGGAMYDCQGVVIDDKGEFQQATIIKSQIGHLKDSPFCPY